MEGAHEDVETSHFPFSSAVSPPHEVDGLSQIWPLPRICYGAKMDGPQPLVPKYLCQLKLAFLHVMFNSVFESFSLATTCSHTTC